MTLWKLKWEYISWIIQNEELVTMHLYLILLYFIVEWFVFVFPLQIAEYVLETKFSLIMMLILNLEQSIKRSMHSYLKYTACSLFQCTKLRIYGKPVALRWSHLICLHFQYYMRINIQKINYLFCFVMIKLKFEMNHKHL